MKCRIVILFSIILLCNGYMQACPAVHNPLRIYFHHGYSTLDPSLRDNRRTLDKLTEHLEKFSSDTTKILITITVEGHASPDGLHEANLLLSKRRVGHVLEYIRARVPLPDSLIATVAEGVDWDGLAAMVEADGKVPAREEVLDILRNTPVWIYNEEGRIIDGRKKRLMDLYGGTVYRLLRDRFFAELRNCTIELRYKTGNISDKKQVPEQTSAYPQEPPYNNPAPRTETTEHAVPAQRTPEQLPERASSSAKQEPLHRLALKTNLLYDAVLMPSLEIEYRIDDRWSVSLEGETAWWSRSNRHKYYQIASIGPEARYWFGVKKPWHGHYAGVFAGGSWYDLENGKRGYKGEFWTAGFSYGYMFPIGRSLSLEAGIGLGFLHTRYEEYLPIDGHYVYQQTSRTDYFGPVKLKFALVWRLWEANRKGGAR